MNDRLAQHIVKHRKLITQLGAVSAVGYGFIVAKMMLQNDKILAQAEYLAKVVQKNIDNLDEFDIIALTDLGLIKQQKND